MRRPSPGGPASRSRSRTRSRPSPARARMPARDVERRSIQRRGARARRLEALLTQRVEHDPGKSPRRVLAGHADREHWNPEEEVDGPVERVDEPAQLAAATARSPLLPQDRDRRAAAAPRTARIADSAATSASDTRSVGVLLVRTPSLRPKRSRNSTAAACAACTATSRSSASAGGVGCAAGHRRGSSMPGPCARPRRSRRWRALRTAEPGPTPSGAPRTGW